MTLVDRLEPMWGNGEVYQDGQLIAKVQYTITEQDDQGYIGRLERLDGGNELPNGEVLVLRVADGREIAVINVSRAGFHLIMPAQLPGR